MMESTGLSAAVLTVIADASLKASVLLAGVALWTLLDRSASAAARHLVWTLALMCVTVLLIIVPFAPAWRVALPLPDRPTLNLPGISTETHEVAADAPLRVTDAVIADGIAVGHVRAGRVGTAASVESPVSAVSVAPIADFARLRGVPVAGAVAGMTGDDAAAASASGPGSTGVALLLVWLAGMIAVATPVVRAFVRLKVIERTAGPFGSLLVRGVLAEVAAAMGIRREVRLLAGPRHSMPMTWGIVRPVVMMPAESSTWSAARLRTVLRHELAHVQRRDALTHCIAEVACILHWFNPLVWLAAKQLRQESEHACDDRVLATGSVPADYASELVGLARSLRPVRAAELGGIAMARGRSLRGRLVAVLDERRNRSTVSTAQAVRASVLAMLVIVPLACLAPAVRADSARMLEAPVARAVTAPDVPVSDAPATMRVWAAERPTAPRPTIRVQGAQADPDLTVRVLRQAAARDLGDREMANLLEVAVNAGAVSSVATRDAFMAAARTIGGDRDRARALDAFLETGPDEAGVIAAVDAAAGMGSDREVARILTKAIGVRPLTQELRDTFVRVMEGIGSDRERRRVAEALLSAGG